MCGRMTIAAKPADLARALPWAPPVEEELLERYNVAPTQDVLVLTDRGWQALRWGLVPHWAKAPREVGARFINARVETLAEKPMFRDYYQERRCLVPTTGFYEWKREGKQKTPFHVTSPESPILVLAGIWAGWGKGDERLYSFTVLTRPAEGPVAELHNRMPVVMPLAQTERWLKEPIPTEELAGFELPLALREVSSYVNNASHEGPECLLPLQGRS